MKTMGGSYHDLAALAAAEFSDARQSYKASPLGPVQSASTQSLDSTLGKSRCVTTQRRQVVRRQGSSALCWQQQRHRQRKQQQRLIDDADGCKMLCIAGTLLLLCGRGGLRVSQRFGLYPRTCVRYACPTPTHRASVNTCVLLRVAACCCASNMRRLIIVSNVLPIRGRKEAHGWEWEWDQDALVAQAKVRRWVGGWLVGGVCVMLRTRTPFCSVWYAHWRLPAKAAAASAALLRSTRRCD